MLAKTNTGERAAFAADIGDVAAFEHDGADDAQEMRRGKSKKRRMTGNVGLCGDAYRRTPQSDRAALSGRAQYRRRPSAVDVIEIVVCELRPPCGAVVKIMLELNAGDLSERIRVSAELPDALANERGRYAIRRHVQIVAQLGVPNGRDGAALLKRIEIEHR